MTKNRVHAALFAAFLSIAACSSPQTTGAMLPSEQRNP